MRFPGNGGAGAGANGLRLETLGRLGSPPPEQPASMLTVARVPAMMTELKIRSALFLGLGIARLCRSIFCRGLRRRGGPTALFQLFPRHQRHRDLGTLCHRLRHAGSSQ